MCLVLLLRKRAEVTRFAGEIISRKWNWMELNSRVYHFRLNFSLEFPRFLFFITIVLCVSLPEIATHDDVPENSLVMVRYQPAARVSLQFLVCLGSPDIIYLSSSWWKCCAEHILLYFVSRSLFSRIYLCNGSSSFCLNKNWTFSGRNKRSDYTAYYFYFQHHAPRESRAEHFNNFKWICWKGNWA